MIIGMGDDLCDIRRMETALNRHGDRFLNRCFTETERAKAATRKGKTEPAATLAKRFAAKEACVKALGTGFNHGIGFRHVGVVNTASGKPTLALTGPALDRLNAMTPKGMTARIHITLGDEFPYARASVIIEAIDSTLAALHE